MKTTDDTILTGNGTSTRDLAGPRPQVSPAEGADVQVDLGGAPPPASPPPGPDKHADIADLRLSQEFGQTGGTKKLLLTVPVRKPGPQEWVTVNPDGEMHFAAALIVQKEEGEMFVVSAALRDQLAGEWVPMMLYLATNRQGVTFLWPVRLPGEDGRLDRWSESATEAVRLAMGGWIRMKSNRALGAYEVHQPLVDFPAPVWPDKTIGELVMIGFKGRVISSADHPVLRALRGEV